MLFAGRALDGPSAPTGSLTLWPGPGRLAGWLSFTVRPLPGQTLRFAIAGRAHPDGRVVLRVCARSRWQVSYTAGTGRGRGEQLGLQQVIAGAATTPVFHPNAALCPSPHPYG